jgi:hypothetical protein
MEHILLVVLPFELGLVAVFLELAHHRGAGVRDFRDVIVRNDLELRVEGSLLFPIETALDFLEAHLHGLELSDVDFELDTAKATPRFHVMNFQIAALGPESKR